MSRAAASRVRPDVVTLTLPDAARARLDALVDARGTTRSEVVRWLLLGDAVEAPTATELLARIESLRSRVDALERAAVVASRRLDGRE